MSYTIADLQTLMARLRDPQDGCPWDLKQTFESVAPHTLEEVYELVDAIEQGDTAQIRQELGDVLFQLIFYSQLGKECGDFDFDDVVHEIATKLLRRHPHVFPEGSLESRRDGQAPDDERIKARWEEIKQQERAEKSQHSLMDDIPTALPASTRAVKLQKRARQLGFDWDNIHAVFDALRGELAELEVELEAGDNAAIADEMGDVLFSAINLCRHLKLDPETVLRAAGGKFERRFRYVEQRAREEGIAATEGQNPQLDMFWTEAKRNGL
jgi:nucleoside triphosphate diphosphatase